MRLPSHGTVVAYIALFVALGGTGYAALNLPKNSVGTRQIKKNAVTGAKVKNGSLTGSDLVASTLGTVPSASTALRATHAETAGDASTLEGSGPSAFVHGTGSVIVARRDLVEGEAAPPIDVPGVARVLTGCLTGQNVNFGLENSSGGTVDVSEVRNEGTPSVFSMANGETKSFTAGTSTADYQVSTRAATPTVATIHVVLTVGGPKACTAFAQAIVGK